MFTLVLRGLLAGILSTLTMDLGSTLVRKTGLTSGLEPRLIGRWFLSLARGQPIHGTVLQVAAEPGEMPVALVGHYAIGVTLTMLFVAVVGAAARPSPSTALALALALGFGLLTELLPGLWMFPAMGFGAFGRQAPAELMLLRTSLVNHLIFGVGLAIFTRWLGLLGSA